MSEKLVKIAVGLALESALVRKAGINVLLSLYSNPDVDLVRETHDSLIASDEHRDREAAIWLEVALDQGLLKSDPRRLAAEMREMEFILGTLINRAGRAQRDVNDWMNYIANAAQFIIDGFWIDAKIFLSRGMQISRTPSIESLKSHPSLRHEVDVLQRATASYFEEMKGYPLSLQIPEEKLDVIITVQENMLELMQSKHKVESMDEANFIRQIVNQSSSAMRYLMERKDSDAKRELHRVLEHLEMWREIVGDEATRGRIDVYTQKMKHVINTI